MTPATFPSTRKRTILQTLFLICGCLVVITFLTLAIKPASTSASAPTISSSAGDSLAPNACQWTIVTSPNPTQFSSLGGIKALSANDIWAVGTYKTTNPFSIKNLTEHWDGSTWSVVPSPNVDPSGGPYTVNQLFAVDGIASNDVWAVGKVLYGAETLHWDGTQWNDVPLPNFNSIGDLRSVKMLSHNDVWAVSVIPGSTTNTAIIHWDGVQWNIVYTTIMDPSGPTGLYSLTVVSPTDMWAAGSIVMHYNGTEWSEVAGAVPVWTIYYAIHAISANDIWAVGADGDQQNVSVHYDGTSWTPITNPNPDTSGWLLAVGGLASNDVWAVGHSQPSGSSYGEGQAMHWNGSAWTSAVVQERDENGELDAIALLPSGEKWAVGYSNLHDGVTEHTLIERYTCDSATSTATSVGATATATPRPPTATRSPTHSSSATATRTATPVVTGTLIPPTLTPTQPPAATATPCTSYMYTDMPCGSTFYPYVECLASYEIVNGYPCGINANDPCDSENRPYYHPYLDVTRGQIAKIVSRSAGFGDPGVDQLFEDVAVGSTFYPFVQALAYRGYISGYECGHDPNEPCGPQNLHYFRPNTSASRGQVSKIITRAAGYTDPHTNEQSFEDVPKEIPGNPGTPAHPFHDYVEELHSRNVIDGYECGQRADEPCVPPLNRKYFRPAEITKRGQLTKLVSMTFFPGCPRR